MSSSVVNKEAFYIPSGEQKLFAWRYLPDSSANHSSHVVVLCPPIGHEYMSVHRAYRHLARAIARKGLAVVCFDYHNTGDSSGEMAESLSLESCVADTIAVCQFLKVNYSGLSCIGFSFGSVVACLASKHIDMDALILWEVRSSGRRYLRALRALAGISNKALACSEKIEILDEAAGIFLTNEFCQQLEAFDLSECAFTAKRHLILQSQENAKLTRLVEREVVNGVHLELKLYDGYEDIVAYPTETVVPSRAIEELVEWLADNVDSVDNLIAQGQGKPELQLDKQMMLAEIQEELVSFGEKKLFGVLCQSTHSSRDTATCVVFLNCGSEHHVGPHRVYTDYCRKLAKQGLVCFRFDIEGIGDSTAMGNNQENYPYSPCALKDVQAALVYLRERVHQPTFILAGICAGAFHSFSASTDLKKFNIRKAFLINPLVFHWSETAVDKVEDRIHLADKARYRAMLGRAEFWIRLVKNPSLLWVGLRFLGAERVNFLRNRLAGSLTPAQQQVRKALRHLAKRGVRTTVVVAEGDPGELLLREEGGSVVKELEKAGVLKILSMKNVDHGLSRKWMRDQVFSEIERAITAPK